ncbi:MAG: YafY family transcriptional regulator [Ignavibacteriae bacterium]|nr:YafY family transcriptional regulator [Ignavibacteriota bacterium]
MNRTDRLLAIVLELQNKGTVRAEDLAGTFSVTKRTIYRDVQALSEAGVPVAAEPGVGYSLVEGYFLPPVNLTNDEAMMLVLGADFVSHSFGREYCDVASSASRKVEAVLSKPMRKEVQEQKRSMWFLSMNSQHKTHEVEILKRVRQAVLERKTIRFTYYKRYAQEREGPLSREVDPYILWHISGNWLVGGYDHLRKATRSFRLSRIEKLEITEKQFSRPKNFLKDFGENQKFDIIVKALFNNSVARWVLESRPFFLASHRRTSQGLHVVLKSNNMDQIVPWLLSWGSNVKVLSPDSLRKHLAVEAEQVLSAHK